MYSKTARFTCWRPVQTRRLMSSFLKVAFHDSAAALSKQLPVWPTDGMMPLSRQASRNFVPVYWLPRSVNDEFTLFRPAVPNSNFQGLDGEFFAHVVRDSPADDLS